MSNVLHPGVLRYNSNVSRVGREEKRIHQIAPDQSATENNHLPLAIGPRCFLTAEQLDKSVD